MKYLIIAALTALALLAVACGDDDDDGSSQTPSATIATVTPSPTYNPTPIGSVSLVDVCGLNPNPATGEQVVVDSPGPSDHVTSPVAITGKIAVFEAQFNIAIKDAGRNDIATASGHSAEGQTLAPFSVEVPFTVTQPTVACIWVFDISNADGVSPIMVHQVPVVLEP